MSNKINIIAEIGINHNGSLEMCKQMIMLAKVAGVDYVKIQKRNPDICVPDDQKLKRRVTPWGEMSYLEYKHKIEFSEDQIKELVDFSKSIGVKFFASVWDKDSIDIMAKYTDIGKIGSASITDIDLCKYAREKFKTLIVSTGMSTEKEVSDCIQSCNPDVVMHTNSSYPCKVEDLNLNYIVWLKNKYPKKKIGYSGHEYGLVTTFASVALGASWVERHITLDRNLWGSDQTSSIEPSGLFKLVKGIRDIEKATKLKPQERVMFDEESSKRDSLRKVK